MKKVKAKKRKTKAARKTRAAKKNLALLPEARYKRDINHIKQITDAGGYWIQTPSDREGYNAFTLYTKKDEKTQFTIFKPSQEETEDAV